MNQITESLPTVAIARLTAAIASITTGVTFAGVTYRSKESGELARHVLILGASYENTVRNSLAIIAQRANIVPDSILTRTLQNMIETYPKGTMERKEASETLKSWQAMAGPVRSAAAELYVSFEDTLTGILTGQENKRYTKAGLYESICPGLKVSRADGSFELVGLAHSKVVLEEGTFKHVNSSEKTIAKEDIRRALPIGKFRTLSLDIGALESLRVCGIEVDVT